MTRGKHTHAAAVRREASEQAAEVALYQKKIRQLTDEVEGLKRNLAEIRRAHGQEVKSLRAQVREGVSPALAVAQQETLRQRERADKAEAIAREEHRRVTRMMGAVQQHEMREHGGPPFLKGDYAMTDQGMVFTGRGYSFPSDEATERYNREYGLGLKIGSTMSDAPEPGEFNEEQREYKKLNRGKKMRL